MIGRLVTRLRRDRQGAILVEFAMTFPILVILILGGIEISRYILLQQKLEGVAVAMADLVAQAETLTTSDVDNLFAAVDHIAKPFSLGDQGVVIVSSVSIGNGNKPRINWQRRGGGTSTATSALGTPPGIANLPDGFILRAGESVIVAEVYYSFEPFLGQSFIPAREIYHRAMFRPRFGTLTSLN